MDINKLNQARFERAAKESFNCAKESVYQGPMDPPEEYKGFRITRSMTHGPKSGTWQATKINGGKSFTGYLRKSELKADIRNYLEEEKSSTECAEKQGNSVIEDFEDGPDPFMDEILRMGDDADELAERHWLPSEYEKMSSKEVYDQDGFTDIYEWWMNPESGHSKFFFGDTEDWETDSLEEAQEWFDNYHGFEDDEDAFEAIASQKKEQWQRDADAEVKKFGRLGGKSYDEMDRDGFYYDDRDGKVKEKVAKEDASDDKIFDDDVKKINQYVRKVEKRIQKDGLSLKAAREYLRKLCEPLMDDLVASGEDALHDRLDKVIRDSIKDLGRSKKATEEADIDVKKLQSPKIS